MGSLFGVRERRDSGGGGGGGGDRVQSGCNDMDNFRVFDQSKVGMKVKYGSRFDVM